MTYAEILTLLAGLASPAVDGPLAQIVAVGVDPDVPVAIAPCPRPIGPTEIEGKTIVCGTVAVPENHAEPKGKHIELFFTLMKSKSTYPEPAPVVYLHGGPGSSVGSLEVMAKVFDPFRVNRDVVMFDQRAAGLSSASVTCYDALGTNLLSIAGVGKAEAAPEGPEPNLAKCMAEMKANGVDLGSYNTLQNAYDVTSIMGTLGYDSFNLYGISYGTKLAMEVMRSSPKGVRAVILDGVAPPWVKLYDTLPTPLDETIESMVVQCGENEQCNAAYPDLGKVFDEVLAKSLKGELMLHGEVVGPEKVVVPIIKRNESAFHASMTPYLPAYYYELYRGKESPTYDMFQNLEDYKLPLPEEDAVTKAAEEFPEGTQQLVGKLIDDVAIELRAKGGQRSVIEELRASAQSTSEGPLAELFDDELTAAAVEYVLEDKSRAGKLVAEYAALQGTKPGAQGLTTFVRGFAQGDRLARLEAIIAAMSPLEISATFARVGRETYKVGGGFVRNFDQRIYACQEDVPYNSIEGYNEVSAGLVRPVLQVAALGVMQQLLADCTLFEKHERSGFHDVVVSDIPTLSFGSDWDVQTASSWAAEATKGLTNAQAFYIYEAGHGAILFQPCVSDMAAAFFNDPSRKFDNTCAAGTKLSSYYIAPWVSVE